MSTLASIHLASLSNAYWHAYLARIGNPTGGRRRKEDEVEEDFSPSGTQQVPFSGCMHAGLMQTVHALA